MIKTFFKKINIVIVFLLNNLYKNAYSDFNQMTNCIVIQRSSKRKYVISIDFDFGEVCPSTVWYLLEISDKMRC